MKIVYVITGSNNSRLMSDNPTKNKFDLNKILNSLALLLCAFCLGLIAVGMQPIAKWAKNQNICVSEEISKSNAPISWGVRKCNGRSKVYKVTENASS